MPITPIQGCACPLCEKNLPTVFPAADFNADEDATALRNAMKGWGCDNEEVINVLGKRTGNQRNAIEAAYKSMYGKDLVDDLKEELGGSFESLVLALMMPWPHVVAKQIKEACKGAGTDEDTLIDYLCTANNCQIREIVAAFKELYGEDLEDVLKSELDGNFQNLMVAVAQGGRNEDQPVDPAKAKDDAAKLMEAGELKWGTDEGVFTAVLVRNSYAQLDAVSAAYEELAGRTLEEAIDSELGGHIENAAKAILAVAKNKDGFWAKRLHDAMSGLGTDDKTLITIIVLRSELDLGNIAKEYQNLYEKSLADAVADEASGDYQKLLVALVGGGN